MAQYDGSIRIKTEINSKNAAVQLAALENRIEKTADKVASLRSKMDALKDVQIPTKEYSEISAQIEKAEQKFNKLLEKQEQMQRDGKDNGAAWQRLNDQIDEAGNELRFAQGELQDLVNTGKAFTLGSDTEEFAKLSKQLKYAENDLAVLVQRQDILIEKSTETQFSYVKLGDAVKNAFGMIGRGLIDIPIAAVKKGASGLLSIFSRIGNTAKNAFGKIAKGLVSLPITTVKKGVAGLLSMFSRLGSVAKSTFSKLGKGASSANKGFSGMSLSLKNILKYGFGIRSLFVLVNKLRAAIKEGFANLYNENTKFKRSVDELKASALTLKNAFAAAFRPLVEVAIPYIQRVLDYMTKLVDAAGQVMAALMGQKKYT